MAKWPSDIVKQYSQEGLARLSKEKLVTIISDYQNMPTEVALKTTEHIPQYLDICDEGLKSVVSAYNNNVEHSEQDAQKVFQTYESQKELFEKLLEEAQTDESRGLYIKALKDLNKDLESFRTKREKERHDDWKEFAKTLLPFVALAGACIGISVKFGRRK